MTRQMNTQTTVHIPRRRSAVPMSRLVGRGLCAAVVVALASSVALAQQADRSRPPALGPAPQLTLPEIQKRTLSNGLTVWLIEAHAVPLVQVNLLIHTGTGDDPAGEFGLASLTAAMLDEGAGTRSALDIADALEFLGANLSTTSSFDSSAVRLNVPVARLADALPIMADIARRPTFPDAELDRLRQDRLTALIQAKDDAAQVAPLAFARVLYGPTHRYGTGQTGTEATLKTFTTDELRRFHASSFQPANATLVVAGDVTMASVVPLLEEHFGDWRTTAAPPARTPVPQAPQVTARSVTIVDLPGTAQAQIRIGGIGVSRATPDYFTLQVLNTILGGSFTSRLNQNLREDHGYSYGASSRFDMRLAAGPFQAAAGVQIDKTAESLTEFFKELNGIREPVSDDELAKAKNYVALSFPAEFEAIGDLAAHVEEQIVYALPDNYFSTYVGNIQAVTADAVQKAAATYVQPSRLAVVVIGDRKVIEAPIRALDLGPVRVLTVDEALGNQP